MAIYKLWIIGVIYAHHVLISLHQRSTFWPKAPPLWNPSYGPLRQDTSIWNAPTLWFKVSTSWLDRWHYIDKLFLMIMLTMCVVSVSNQGPLSLTWLKWDYARSPIRYVMWCVLTQPCPNFNSVSIKPPLNGRKHGNPWNSLASFINGTNIHRLNQNDKIQQLRFLHESQ